MLTAPRLREEVAGGMREFFRSAPLASDVDAEEKGRRFEALAKNLETLASSTRLEILHSVRAPRTVHEIRAPASLTRGDENPDRPLSRQAVTRHLDILLDAGLVRRVEGGPEDRGDAFVLSHERLFAIVDEMRNLAKLRPLVAEMALTDTITHDEAGAPKLPPGSRLLVAFGRDDGLAFALDGAVGRSWRIGRGASADIRLDYDPFLSNEHALLERQESGFRVVDRGSHNGTWVNWTRLPAHAARSLVPGDLLTVGRTVLAFQP